MSSQESLISLLPVSPAAWVQALFILASCFVFSITVAPAAERKLLLNYGPRRSHGSATPDPAPGRQNTVKREAPHGDALLKTVRALTSRGQVPHSWFFTYYAFYILCAGFWAVQYFQRDNNILRSLASRQAAVASDRTTMVGGQAVVVWFMTLLQTGRRLYECFAVLKPSESTMWFVHWLMGLAYYLGVSVAIWIEASAAILQDQLRVTSLSADAKVKAAVALPLFLLGWVMQHHCHRHLAGLKKYSLPELGLFRYLVCPHYTCECLIYLSLAVVAAPEGRWCNRTLLSVLMFVAVNLGVTGSGTRNWYIDKFGPERVVGKWIMVPFLY